jgi:hypothetical protein
MPRSEIANSFQKVTAFCVQTKVSAQIAAICRTRVRYGVRQMRRNDARGGAAVARPAVVRPAAVCAAVASRSKRAVSRRLRRAMAMITSGTVPTR